MKKLIASLAFAGLVSTGLAGAAHADPYTGTVKTDTGAKAPVVVPAGKAVRIKVNIDVVGNAVPKGTVKFVVRKPNGKKVKVVEVKYAKAKRFTVGKLPNGKYKVAVKFTPKANSVWTKSRDLVKFKVGA